MVHPCMHTHVQHMCTACAYVDVYVCIMCICVLCNMYYVYMQSPSPGSPKSEQAGFQQAGPVTRSPRLQADAASEGLRVWWLKERDQWGKGLIWTIYYIPPSTPAPRSSTLPSLALDTVSTVSCVSGAGGGVGAGRKGREKQGKKIHRFSVTHTRTSQNERGRPGAGPSYIQTFLAVFRDGKIGLHKDVILSLNRRCLPKVTWSIRWTVIGTVPFTSAVPPPSNLKGELTVYGRRWQRAVTSSAEVRAWCWWMPGLAVQRWSCRGGLRRQRWEAASTGHWEGPTQRGFTRVSRSRGLGRKAGEGHGSFMKS